jgi:glutaredoxin
MKISKNILFFWIGAVLIALGLLIGLWLWQSPQDSAGNLDEFAQCLSQKGVVMYGLESCSHCQNQKKLFGSSFQYVNYIECRAEPGRCLENEIQQVPAWVFPDGKKLEGEQSLEKLSQASGCRLAD